MRVVLLGYLAWNDLASEFVQPAQETPDLAVAVSLIEVVRPEVSVGDPIAEHEIRGGQHGGCNRQDCFFGATAGLQAQKLSVQVAGLDAHGRPGSGDQRRLQPGSALAHPRGAALAGALVVPRAQAGPGR